MADVNVEANTVESVGNNLIDISDKIFARKKELLVISNMINLSWKSKYSVELGNCINKVSKNVESTSKQIAAIGEELKSSAKRIRETEDKNKNTLKQ